MLFIGILCILEITMKLFDIPVFEAMNIFIVGFIIINGMKRYMYKNGIKKYTLTMFLTMVGECVIATVMMFSPAYLLVPHYNFYLVLLIGCFVTLLFMLVIQKLFYGVQNE